MGEQGEPERKRERSRRRKNKWGDGENSGGEGEKPAAPEWVQELFDEKSAQQVRMMANVGTG